MRDSRIGNSSFSQSCSTEQTNNDNAKKSSTYGFRRFVRDAVYLTIGTVFIHPIAIFGLINFGVQTGKVLYNGSKAGGCFKKLENKDLISPGRYADKRIGKIKNEILKIEDKINKLYAKKSHSNKDAQKLVDLITQHTKAHAELNVWKSDDPRDLRQAYITRQKYKANKYTLKVVEAANDQFTNAIACLPAVGLVLLSHRSEFSCLSPNTEPKDILDEQKKILKANPWLDR